MICNNRSCWFGPTGRRTPQAFRAWTGLLWVALSLLYPAASAADALLFNPPRDPVPGIPTEFPRFYIAGKDKEAQALTRMAWNLVSGRPPMSRPTPGKEQVLLGDMWMGNLVEKSRRKTLAEIHRDDLLGLPLDEEGAVHAQHYLSFSHERGWPFPLWTQVQGGFNGKTVGWHFQATAPALIAQTAPANALANFVGENAIQSWETTQYQSLGILGSQWQLRATGINPLLISPVGVEFQSENAPYLQIRWSRSGSLRRGQRPYVEWMRAEDLDFSESRRMYFGLLDDTNRLTNLRHSLLPMFRHPLWVGKIKRLRIAFAPSEADFRISLDSIFTTLDTRIPSSNASFILASWTYFKWSGDIEFLGRNANRMRQALRYQQQVLDGSAQSMIRVLLPGHDGRSGVTLTGNQRLTHPNRGLPSNEYDLLPIGYDDFPETVGYYECLLALAEMEEALLNNPMWALSPGVGFSPKGLRAEAANVRKKANETFWNPVANRFVACRDADGLTHDYGFTHLNLEAVVSGLAEESKARLILDWVSGRRLVSGDTSQAEDIYAYRLAPRATTRANQEWLVSWWTPQQPYRFGSQWQDGGALLAHSYFDLKARLEIYGPSDAWQRLLQIIQWEEEVAAEGGYRKYFRTAQRGTLQGGGTRGTLGVDAEFFESTLVPAFIVHGFLGLKPLADSLTFDPRLPAEVPEMGVKNLAYRHTRLDVRASANKMEILQIDPSSSSLWITVPDGWKSIGQGEGRKVALTHGKTLIFLKD